MSIINSIKSALGVGGSGAPTYECVDCGATFESGSKPGGPWIECPECGSESPLGESDG